MINNNKQVFMRGGHDETQTGSWFHTLPLTNSWWRHCTKKRSNKHSWEGTTKIHTLLTDDTMNKEQTRQVLFDRHEI